MWHEFASNFVGSPFATDVVVISEHGITLVECSGYRTCVLEIINDKNWSLCESKKYCRAASCIR
ncbi:hypothetical protein [Pseudomonas sp. EL_65y_Pfl2_R95]|uniref:hypothetical protein n=1 Tax=Pseudomonas sp. EL_65y_Pfl2_R95 TaxID=3088698 RepID=UPI0040408867